MMRNNTLSTIMKIIAIGTILLTNILHICANDNIINNKPQFPTLSFQEYLNQVGKNNLGYIAEKYNIQIADAEVMSQRVFPDPELSVEAFKNGKSKDELGHGFSFELSYMLELGNKRGARINLAKSQADLERLMVDNFFQELRTEAADAFLDAMMQKELLSVKKSSYEYMRQFSISDSIRFSLGEINETEARQSKLESITLLNEVYNQEAVYKSSLVTLCQFMGKSINELDMPVGEWGLFRREYTLTDLVNQALLNRVDLLASLKNSEVATNQLKLTRAERKLDLGLSLGYEVNAEVRNEIAPTPAFNAVKAGVSIPLKFSNTNKGAVKSAEYAIQKTKAEYRNVELQIQKEVAQAFFGYESMQKQVKQYNDGLLSDSQKLLSAMEYKYKRGETSILEVLVAQRTYNEIQEQYLEIIKGYGSALIELQKTCGIWDIEL